MSLPITKSTNGHRRWLIDFDGCLSNTFALQLEKLNEKFGTIYHERHFRVWATEEVLKQEEASYIWDTLFLDYDFQMSVPPVSGAIDLIQALHQLGDTLYVVSDRPNRLLEATQDWMSLYGIGHIPIIFTRNKHTKSDQHNDIPTKADFATARRLTHVIEDSGMNALALVNVPSVEKVFLRHLTNNRKVIHPRIQRIHQWSEVIPQLLKVVEPV